MLLREMAESAGAQQDSTSAQRCSEQADAAEHYLKRIRELVLSQELFARIPSIGSPRVRTSATREKEGGRRD